MEPPCYLYQGETQLMYGILSG